MSRGSSAAFGVERDHLTLACEEEMWSQ
jgi:hypothetical protein